MSDRNQQSRPISLPNWTDSRLVVRVASYSDAALVIDGNPHTFDGTLRLYDPVANRSVSVRPNDITDATDYGLGWLAGYVAGGEPAGPSAPDVAALRRERERAFYTRYQRELPAARRGQFVVAASREAWYGTIEDIQTAMARMVARLGNLYPAWRGNWLPSNRRGVDKLRMDSTQDVARIFHLLNAGADLGLERAGWPQISVFTADPDAGGLPAGAIEVTFEGYLTNNEIAEYSLIVNLERPDLLIDANNNVGQPELALESIQNAVIECFDVDVASISTGRALLHAEEITFSPADDTDDLRNGSSVVPGWRTYVSSRLISSTLPTSAELDIQHDSNGVHVRSRRPLLQFSLDDAHQVSNYLADL